MQTEKVNTYDTKVQGKCMRLCWINNENGESKYDNTKIQGKCVRNMSYWV